jgi:hypothetical protein
MIVPEAPKNPIGDNAYDSDKLDAELRQYGIELIAPHRSNRKHTEHKTCAAFADIVDVGRSRDCLPRCKTSEDYSLR